MTSDAPRVPPSPSQNHISLLRSLVLLISKRRGKPRQYADLPKGLGDIKVLLAHEVEWAEAWAEEMASSGDGWSKTSRREFWRLIEDAKKALRK